MTNNPVRGYGHWLWVVLAVMALLAPGPASAAETVTVTGVSFYEPGREALARDKALEDAKRMAIEQALGVHVESRTVVENFEVTRDQVLSHASGYLRDMEILREGKTELGTYEVELRAAVEIGALVADMDRFRKILGWQKNPRVAVVLPPDLDPSYRSAARRAANRLSRQLKRGLGLGCAGAWPGGVPGPGAFQQ